MIQGMAANDVKNPDSKEKLIFVTEGSSGTENFAGYIQEDYLAALHGSDAADIYDKMRRGDYQVRMNLNSVKNPLKSATWSIEPFDDSPDAQLYADFINHVLFDDMANTWTEFLTEAFTFIDFGYSLFEKQHKIVLDHAEWGSYIGLRRLHWRSQRTIERWNVDENEDLVSVSQEAFGDGQKAVDIPAKNLVSFHWEKEGQNFEGISMLRPCYGPWKRKEIFLKLMAIGIEKYAVPTPVGKAPQGAGPGTEEYDAFKAALKLYLTHQQQYLIVPHGWEIELQNVNFDPEKTRQAVDAEDRAMTKAFLANFLEIGINTTNGSRSVANDLSDFFMAALKQVAKVVSEKFNREIIPELVRMNFGNVAEIPWMQVSGIDDSAGLDLANALKALTESKILTPDDRLEANIRNLYQLPEMDKDTQRQVEAPAAPTPAATFDEVITAAEKTARGQITDAAKELKKKMREDLVELAAPLIKQIAKDFGKLPPKKRVAAYKGKSISGVNRYAKSLRDEFARVAAGALARAKSEVPIDTDSQFAESDDYYKELAAQTIALIKAEADLLAQTQIADLEKQIFHQFVSSATSTEAEAVIAKDLEDAVKKHAEGPSIVAAAGNSAALIINETRNAYFFTPDVLDEIHSFTFLNPDPKSAVCKDLVNRTFAKDDPEAARFFPPLHHNCKSYLRPNLVAREIDPRGLMPSTKESAKAITLSKKP